MPEALNRRAAKNESAQAPRGSEEEEEEEEGDGALSAARRLRASCPLLLALCFSMVAHAQTLDGHWLGTLKAGAQSLRIQLTVKSEGGALNCSLDSLDQGALGIPCANVTFADPDLSFDVPAVKGRWTGKLSADHNSLAGTWAQGGSLPLTFDRQQAAVKPAAARGMDPAMPPVSAADMQAVLTRDLEQAPKDGRLAPGSPIGLSVGVIRNGVRSVFTFGAAKRDSLFEIGSITKTFTGLVLAQMTEQGKVTPETPVRELLPAGTVKKPVGAEITLLDLTTQRSGLPRLPDNLKPADPANPYIDYDARKLYEYLGQRGVARPADATFLYSNLGVGLLGHALSLRARKPYPELVKEEITEPLGMKDTAITLTPAQQSRFIQGYSADRHAVHSWELDALAGAGAIRSTAGDMLTYLEAQLHPDKLAGHLKPGANSRTLPAAIVRSQTVQADAAPIGKIAFNWLRNDQSGDYLHDGATAGFSSFAFFNPKEDFGAVVLVNTGPETQPFATLVGVHIRQRFTGAPAISLAARN